MIYEEQMFIWLTVLEARRSKSKMPASGEGLLVASYLRRGHQMVRQSKHTSWVLSPSSYIATNAMMWAPPLWSLPYVFEALGF